MKIHNVEFLKVKIDCVFEEVSYLVLNYVYCTDENEDLEEYETYLFKCHTVEDELKFMWNFGIIDDVIYGCLKDVVRALICRHIGAEDYISKIPTHYRAFDI